VVWWAWLLVLVGVASVGSVAVAAQRPGRARDATAWLGVVGFYVALVGMFGGWARDALAGGSRAGGIALAVLAALFSIGLVVALSRTVSVLRGGGGSGDPGATH
jgi:hypothetical protein